MSGTTKASVKSNTTTKKPATKAKTTKAAKTAAAKSKTGVVKVKKSVKKPAAKKTSAKTVSKKATKASKVSKATKSAVHSAKAKTVSHQHEAHAVHQVSALHMPAAPRVHAVAKTKINEAWMWVAFFLTFLFVYSVAENVVNAKSGLTGSPSTYAAIPALATAVIVWKANRTKSTYTGMVVVLSMLGAGLFIWLFGVTNASSLLFS